VSVLTDNEARAMRTQMRSSLRAARRALTPQQRSLAARHMAKQVAAQHWLAPGRRIALYVPLRDELDTRWLFALARKRGCLIYLPRIDSMRTRRMRFIALGDGLRRNRYGIYEPTGDRAIGTRWLHYIFVPSVGFDTRGARLGSGAGFYDRALAFRRWRQHWRGPRLVAIGFALQRVPRIPALSHDVFVDRIATECGIDQCEGAS
jgi:5-formyltetrahydrofolate cyclo-ligase